MGNEGGVELCSTSRYFRYKSFGEQVVLKIGGLWKKKERRDHDGSCKSSPNQTGMLPGTDYTSQTQNTWKLSWKRHLVQT